jgi:hypothetical protein
MPIDFNPYKAAPPIEDAKDRTERIREALKKDIRSVVRHLFPKATFTANDARIGDVYGSKGASLSIALRPLDKAGMWIDHANPGEMGDVLTLWQAAMGISDFGKLLAECDAWLGGSQTKASRAFEKKKEAALKEQPDEGELKKVPDADYLYTDVHGNKICTVYRYRLIDAEGNDTGKKSFSIYRYADKKWSAPNPRPLYRLPDISEFTDVVLVEGEKCADALAKIGIEATTASGGSNTKLDHTDWTPLAGKRVFLWADNDETGRDYMRRLEPVLTGIGCEVLRVPLPEDVGQGWDAADAIAEGRDVVSILRAAIPAPSTDHKAYMAHEHWEDITYEYEGEILEDVLPRVGVATLFGPSAAGKSFVVLDICTRIAQGAPAFGRETQPCGILYCAFEGHDGLRKRIHALKTIRGIRNIDLDLIDAPWVINDERQWEHFALAIGKHVEDFASRGVKLGIIVLDTLTSATAGSDTNSQADVTGAMKRLKRLSREHDLLILNVGHTGKDNGRGMVGSFAYKSEADAFLEIRVDMDEKTGEVQRRYLYVDKAKDGASNFTLANFSLQTVVIGTKPNGRAITTCVVNWYGETHITPSEKISPHFASVLKYLEGGAKKIEEIGQHLKLSRSQTITILQTMSRNGSILGRTIGKVKIYEAAKPDGNSKDE